MIGIVGAGCIGQALAGRLIAAGEQILISNSRGSHTLQALAAALGPRLQPATVSQAAKADFVILAVPWGQLPDAVAATCTNDWRGRTVVDATNPIGPPDYTVADLGDRTSSEIVADLVPAATLVKAFNTLSPSILAADPQTAAGRRVVFLSGDHAHANAAVGRLIERAGWAAIDLGPLASGGRLQQFPGGPLPGLNLIKAP